jgi:iron complex outermembrane receptor protein
MSLVSIPDRVFTVILIQMAVFLLLCPARSLGQADRTISGTVVDAETDDPLVGVNILVGGTTTGTATDEEGEFRLDVPEDAAVLEVSYVGYTNREVQLSDGRSGYRIEMEPESALMDEVAVVAYGEQRREDITGSISTADAEDFNQGVNASPGDLIQGVVSGVNVTSATGEPGAAQDIIIRGVGSLRSGTQPLFVIDGVTLSNNSTVPTNPLNFINPEDIESIEVLKDASATALYGARASNGVVVIKTKEGEMEDDTRMSISTSTSMSTLANEIDVFGADEFRDKVAEIGNLQDFGASTDWQDELTRTALTNEVNFSLSGALSEKLNYYASLGVKDQEGILETSNLQRYSGRLNMSQTALNERLNVNYRLNAVQTINKRPDDRAIIRNMLELNPTISPLTDGSPTQLQERLNPLRRNDIFSDETINNRIVADINPSIKITNGLTWDTKLGVDYSESNRNVQTEPLPQISNESVQEGELTNSNQENRNYLVESTLEYQLDRDLHSATFLSGYAFEYFRNEGRFTDMEGFRSNGVDPRFQDNISTNQNPINSDAFAEENKLQSFFGRVNYTYNDTYLITATIRADGSSKFGENSRYGYFPSFALGYNIDEEDFFNVSFVDNLKIRASWGQTGTQAIPNKITKRSITESRQGNNTYPVNQDATSRDGYPFGRIRTRLANPDIQWEVSTQTDVGVDFELFGSRLTGSFDYYRKVSSDILLERTPVDPVTPTSTVWTNVPNMKIKNTGFELNLEHRNSLSTDFQYTIGGNVSVNNNKVQDSPFSILTTGAAQGAGQTDATINGYINGEPIGAFFMLEHDGIGDDGLNKFVDRNGDGEILEDDRFVAGSALPDMLFGFQVNLNYKSIGLDMNFNGALGHQIYNHTAMTSFNRGDLAGSDNTTDLATQFPDEDPGNSNTVSTRYLEDGDYLRLNSATFSYTVSPNLIGLDGEIRTLEVTLTGQNLFTITPYNGFDPEVNTGTEINDIQSFGIDRFTYPRARTFEVGLNLMF